MKPAGAPTLFDIDDNADVHGNKPHTIRQHGQLGKPSSSNPSRPTIILLSWKALVQGRESIFHFPAQNELQSAYAPA